MIELIVRLLVTILLAFLAGKLISKIKLPSILGVANRRNDFGISCDFSDE